MRAIATRTFVDGIVVSDCLAIPALRIRVSISLIGSLTLIRASPEPLLESESFRLAGRPLPARLGDAGQPPDRRQFAEADAADPEFPHVGAAAATEAAPVDVAHLVLRRLL